MPCNFRLPVTLLCIIVFILQAAALTVPYGDSPTSSDPKTLVGPRPTASAPVATTSLPPVPKTTPPPSLHQLDLRQRCWDDRGFSVDCAVWTGYRYTWGPPSNPYDYWSGDGGSGSGGGDSGDANVIAVSEASTTSHILLSYIACLVAFQVVMALWL